MKFKNWIILFLILCVHIFFRFYQLDSKSVFGWDQVDNAWVAKNIIVDHRWPLLGMQAKYDSGFYIGPFYYYLIAFVYFLTNLDPIASGIFAGITSVFTFFVFYWLIKKLFSTKIALIAIFIHTFSSYIISLNRIQWPVNLIAPISLIIFYSLYQVINGRAKYFLLLATALGFSFHLHFTSIFFPLIILLSLPLIPRNKQVLKYGLLSVPLFLIWLVPNFFAEIKSQNTGIRSMINYLETYYHGFHLKRILQVAKDAFIEFEGILFGGPIGYFLLPIFVLVYYLSRSSKKRFVLCYLMGLWFFVPWLVFSVYSGEISNYYLSLTRPMVLIVIAYLTWRLFRLKSWLIKIATAGFFIIYCFVNTQNFLRLKWPSLDGQKAAVKRVIQKGDVIEFKKGSPESYLYYFYTQK